MQDRPDEAAEFSGHSGDGDVAMFTLVETPELFIEAMLSFQGDSNDVRWLSLASSAQDEFGTCTMLVVPGGLHEETPSMEVASLGDGTSVLFVSGGVF